MSQATMSISLPDSLKEYVKERVEEERYSTPSDYMRSLIREDMRRRDEQKLEQMLLEGVGYETVASIHTTTGQGGYE
jgi:antitoxin ParD1/3/4